MNGFALIMGAREAGLLEEYSGKLDSIIVDCRRSLEAARASIALYDLFDNKIILVSASGLRELHLDGSPRKYVYRTGNRGVLGKVARSGEPYIASDTSKDPFYHRWHEGLRSSVAVPIFTNLTRLYGVVECESTLSGHYSVGAEKHLRPFARSIANVLSQLERRVSTAVDLHAMTARYCLDLGLRRLDRDSVVEFGLAVQDVCRGLRALQRHPDSVSLISPQEFENLIALMFEEQRFRVEARGSVYSKDGAIDLIAVRHDRRRNEKYLIQCKRYQKTKRVEVRIIRELAGVHSKHRPTKVVAATSSFFTEDAKLEASGDWLKYQMDLVDRSEILAFIREFLERSREFKVHN